MLISVAIDVIVCGGTVAESILHHIRVPDWNAQMVKGPTWFQSTARHR